MKRLIPIAAVALLFTACKKDDNPATTEKLSLTITGLTDLGTSYKYEGWVLVNGNPVSTGVFTADTTGKLSQTSFDVNKAALDSATDFIVTIEPSPDANPAPSETHILAGSFSGSSAAVSIGNSKALGSDFASATGKYILATPSNGDATNENSGIWFLDISGGTPAKGLTLPTLPAGWKYEGWAVVNGIPLSSGTFLSATGADAAAPYSDAGTTPPFPGEDYLMNAPAAIIFPTNLAGGKAVISIEPSPDNSPAPFLLKPLVADIPAAATDHTTYNMTVNTAGLPTGTASR